MKRFNLFIIRLFEFSLGVQSRKAAEAGSMPMHITNNVEVETFPGGVPQVYSFGGIHSMKEVVAKK